MSKFFVSRQHYFGVEESDARIVEIASGGIDYANADMLGVQYRKEGEGEEYTDPREAAEAAIKICEAWRRDAGEAGPEFTINVGYGHTGGFTMPFEPSTFEEVREWALDRYEQMPKCDRCGEAITGSSYSLCDGTGDKFCSEYCAEREEELRYMRELVADYKCPGCEHEWEEAVEFADADDDRNAMSCTNPACEYEPQVWPETVRETEAA